ncbi:MAG: hypothetical protein WEE64_04405 [Dehalococcoidia bacterium]
MVEEQVSRKRRRRRRRGSGPRNDALAPTTASPESAPRRPDATRPFSDWQWLTFPVFFAFVLGAFLMLLFVAPEDPDTGEAPLYYQVLFLVFLAAVAFCLLHVTVRFARWWLRERG